MARPPGFTLTQFRATAEECGTLANCYVCPNGGAQAPAATENLFDNVLKLPDIQGTSPPRKYQVAEDPGGSADFRTWTITFGTDGAGRSIEQRLATATDRADVSDFANHNFESDVIGGPWLVSILHKVTFSSTRGGYVAADNECKLRTMRTRPAPPAAGSRLPIG